MHKPDRQSNGPQLEVGYWSRLLVIAGSLPPGEVSHVVVEHEAQCPMMADGGFGDCTCRPQVRVVGPRRGFSENEAARMLGLTTKTLRRNS